jgi:hypothetical protein
VYAALTFFIIISYYKKLKKKNFLFTQFNIVYPIFPLHIKKGVPDEGCVG